MLEQFSIFSVILTAIVGFVGGFLWYSPVLFGNIWGESFKKKEGLTDKDLSPSPILIAGAFANVLVMAYGLALLLQWTGIHSIADAALYSFIAWFALIATNQFSSVLWAKKPWTMFLIDTSGSLVQLLFMSLFLVWIS